MKKIEYDNLVFEIFPTVYTPHADSFMLAKFSRDLKGRILDIGCGCGIQSLINAKNNPENRVVGVDINEKAVENSIHNAKLNNIENVEFFHSDLFSEVKEKFDAIIFNPPYLPTSEQEKLRDAENFAFDGGIDGRKILDVFFKEFESYLVSGGLLLLVQSSLNNLEKTKENLLSKKFSFEILNEEKFFFEKIYVIKSRKLR